MDNRLTPPIPPADVKNSSNDIPPQYISEIIEWITGSHSTMQLEGARHSAQIADQTQEAISRISTFQKEILQSITTAVDQTVKAAMNTLRCEQNAMVDTVMQAGDEVISEIYDKAQQVFQRNIQQPLQQETSSFESAEKELIASANEIVGNALSGLASRIDQLSDQLFALAEDHSYELTNLAEDRRHDFEEWMSEIEQAVSRWNEEITTKTQEALIQLENKISEGIDSLRIQKDEARTEVQEIIHRLLEELPERNEIQDALFLDHHADSIGERNGNE
jgi:superoxide dismutase